MKSLLQDLRHSLRGLLRTPGFTFVAVLSLALGIGANTAIFTLIRQVMLHNLPVRDPQQLVTFGTSEGDGILGGIDLGMFDQFTYDFAHQLESQPGPFSGVAYYSSFPPKVSVRNGDAEAAVQVSASLVSGNYFSVLAAAPLFGRTIFPSDADRPNRSAVVVISHHYWQQILSADPAIVGKTISVNSTPFTVVGVMPEAFHGFKQELEPPDLWVPITMVEQIMLQPNMLAPRSFYFLHMFARRSTQSSLSADQGWLDRQIHDYVRAGEGATIAPARQQEIDRLSVRLIPGSHGVSLVRTQYGVSLKILMVVVAIVLLIACGNLANFLLARAVSRQREIATRLALGSTRSRIVRQSLIESLYFPWLAELSVLPLPLRQHALLSCLSRRARPIRLWTLSPTRRFCFSPSAYRWLPDFSLVWPRPSMRLVLLPAPGSAPIREPFRAVAVRAAGSHPRRWL